MQADRLWTNARLMTMAPDRAGLGIIEGGAIVERNGRIAWVGAQADLPAGMQAGVTEDLEGRWVTPGLIDCHTHLVFGGNRAREFEMRLAGESYEAIARAGGGIASTVAATRAADDETLLHSALHRLDALIADGVTTVEVKSGYGLDTATEMRMLRVARRIAKERSVTVRTSFLGAHAIPPEFSGDADAYIDSVYREQLPAVAEEGLADAVDAFCERIAFSPAQVAKVFDAAKAHGLPVKLHAEQLSNFGGAKLAARYGALSADHLEYLDAEGAAALAAAGTVAVLLPGAFYVLKEKQKPPIAALREAGADIALATDCNPGSSPLMSLCLALHMGATFFGLTISECLLGVTRNAARALGLGDEIGTLEPGKWCDLAVWNIEEPAEIVYWLGGSPLDRIHRASRA